MSLWRHARRVSGTSLVEFALLLPVLLLFVLGVVDVGRALQFNNIVTVMSREGANLAARTSGDTDIIIESITEAAAPLDMPANGMVYVTSVMGSSTGSGLVASQYQSTSGNTALKSAIYTCTALGSKGACTVPTGAASQAIGLTLQPGEIVNVVEVLYKFVPLTSFVWVRPATLYAKTIL